MQTGIMSFVRGMVHGEQILPVKDLFVYIPVQLLPDLVKAIVEQGYEKVDEQSGWSYKPRKNDDKDNPFLVAGVYRLEVPLWADLALARHAPFGAHLIEADGDSDMTDTRERSPRLAQPVPVGETEPMEANLDEAADNEDTAEEPHLYLCAGIRTIRYPVCQASYSTWQLRTR